MNTSPAGIPEVKVIVCTAAHDGIKGPAENHCFAFCESNGICSHGFNGILDRAVDRGCSIGVISKSDRDIMRETLIQTRITLSQNIDRLRVQIKMLRTRDPKVLEYTSPEYFEYLQSNIVAELGSDQSLWDNALSQKQLEIALPIIQVIEKLRDLGLIQTTMKPTVIDVKTLIDRSFASQSQ